MSGLYELEHLDIGDNPIHIIPVSPVWDKELSTLTLDHTGIDDDSISPLLTRLSEPNSLRFLDLSGNNITQRYTELLEHFARIHPEIKIKLDGNPLAHGQPLTLNTNLSEAKERDKLVAYAENLLKESHTKNNPDPISTNTPQVTKQTLDKLNSTTKAPLASELQKLGKTLLKHAPKAANDKKHLSPKDLFKGGKGYVANAMKDVINHITPPTRSR